jgi:enamine deaminase RidA (YjgF/YER057c/UK114 family)
VKALRHAAAPEGAPAGRGYSQVVTGRGRLVVVSGQVAQNVNGELLEVEAWALVDD